MDTTATVAVLFCDQVGSTERLSRMGDVAGDQFRRRLFGELRECVASTNGTEVKNLGDGLMVVFERSTVDALTCARRMHERMAGFEPDDPVHLRIGISVGEVGREDGDWFGTPVVEAARLCGVAGPDQTLAPALVQTLVGSRAVEHRFRPIGTLELKGLPGHLSVVEIDRESGTDGGERDPVGAPGGSSGPAGGRVSGRPRRWPLVVAGIVAVAALVAGALALRLSGDGVTEGAGAADDAAAGSAVPASDTVTEPDGYEPVFEARDCAAAVLAAVPGATCGDLVVPESRGRPDGPQLRVPVTKVSPPGGATAPPVIILDVNEPVTSTSLREVSDVYSLSLRGFDPSAAVLLTCPELTEAWDAALAQRADDPEAIAARSEAAGACAGRLRASGVQLEGYNMAESADDIRDVALALDLDEVSVAAGGYTTTAAVAFARSNPGLVRSLLLTNPTPPGESVLADPATSLGRSFDELIALCEADPSCGPAFDGLAERYDARFEELRSQPVGVSTRAISGAGPFEVLLDGRRFGAALESATRNTGRLGLVPSAVVGASDELTAAAGIDEDVQFYAGPAALPGAFLSLTCSYDAELNRTAEIGDAAQARFAGANEPSFGRMCDAWGVPSVLARLSRPLDVDVPVLFAEGGLAAAGVNGWSESMAQMLPRATVARFPTVSEDLVFDPPPCLREMRRDFLEDPTRELDVEGCEAASPPIDFTGAG